MLRIYVEVKSVHLCLDEKHPYIHYLYENIILLLKQSALTQLSEMLYNTAKFYDQYIVEVFN